MRRSVMIALLWACSLALACSLAGERGRDRGRREGLAVYRIELRVDKQEAKFLGRTGWPMIRPPGGKP